MCVQVSFLHKNTLVGTEDCLVLSVSVPKSTFDKQNTLPVMVWIHGGGFTQGSGSPDTYGTERLMDYGIIGKEPYTNYVDKQGEGRLAKCQCYLCN